MEKGREEEDTRRQISEGGEPSFPHHALKRIAVIYLVLGLVLTLAILAPLSLYEQADPLVVPEKIEHAWYFLTLSGMARYMPEPAAISLFLLGGLLLLIWPFLDRGPERHPKRRPISTALGIAVILGMIVFSILGQLSKRI